MFSPSTIVVFLSLIAQQANGDLTIGKDFWASFACISENITTDPLFNGSIPKLYLAVVNPNNAEARIQVYGFEPPNRSKHYYTENVAAHSTARININSWWSGCSVNPRVNGTGIWLSSDPPTFMHAGLESEDGRWASQFLLLPAKVLGDHYSATPCSRTILVPTSQDGMEISQAVIKPIQNQFEWPTGQVTFFGEFYSFYSKSLYHEYMTNSTRPFNSIATCQGSTFTQLPRTLAHNKFSFLAPPKTESNMTVSIYTKEDNTYITWNGIETPIAYGANTRATFSLQPQEGFSITTNDKLVEVYYGGGNPYLYGQVYSDKVFVSENVSFVALNHTSNGKEAQHLLRLIVPYMSHTKTLTLDNQVIASEEFQKIPNSALHYYYYDKVVSNNKHTIGVTNKETKFLATVYVFAHNSSQPMSHFTVALDLPNGPKK